MSINHHIVKEMSYIPNSAARRLKSDRSYCIAPVTGQLTSEKPIFRWIYSLLTRTIWKGAKCILGYHLLS